MTINTPTELFIKKQITALLDRVSMLHLEAIEGTPAYLEVERQKQSQSYPYTFAYDFIRTYASMDDISRGEIVHVMTLLFGDKIEEQVINLANMAIILRLLK